MQCAARIAAFGRLSLYLLFITALSLSLTTSSVANPPLDRQDVGLASDIFALRSEVDAIKSIQNIQLGVFVFIGFLITVFNFVQTRRDSNMFSFLQKQIEDSNRESTEFGNSSRANIASITSLVNTMNSGFELFNEMRSMLESVKSVTQEHDKVSHFWDNKLNALNETALDLSRRATRLSHNDPDFQRRASDFHASFENIRDSIDISDAVNANCFYILYFYERSRDNYDAALQHLIQALKLCDAHRISEKDTKRLYPGLPSGVSHASWLQKLQNICCYHYSILVYNLGQYSDALKQFRAALTFDKRDYKSLSYIPEVMFLGHLAPFDAVIKEFQSVIEIVSTLPEGTSVGFSESREALLAQIYLKLGNCFLQRSTYTDYSAHRSPLEAAKYLEAALKLNQESSIISFSLAQALHETGRERERATTLFNRAFDGFKSTIGRTSEPKILVMLYYAMAICSSHISVAGEYAAHYIMRIFELIPRLPKPEELRVFSPLTKRDLLVKDLVAELREFETVGVKGARRADTHANPTYRGR